MYELTLTFRRMGKIELLNLLWDDASSWQHGTKRGAEWVPSWPAVCDILPLHFNFSNRKKMWATRLIPHCRKLLIIRICLWFYPCNSKTNSVWKNGFHLWILHQKVHYVIYVKYQKVPSRRFFFFEIWYSRSYSEYDVWNRVINSVRVLFNICESIKLGMLTNCSGF